MSEKRRRRSDAERSRAAVLDAALALLGRRPDASMDEIAAAAGVSRQTVYAHYANRDALLRAMITEITAEVTAAVEGAGLDAEPPAVALRRWVEVNWSLLERYPVLLSPALAEVAARLPGDDHERHAPVTASLRRLLERGRRDGTLDRRLPVDWLLAAVVALGHAAGEAVAAGRMTPAEAGAAFGESVARLCATR